MRKRTMYSVFLTIFCSLNLAVNTAAQQLVTQPENTKIIKLQYQDNTQADGITEQQITVSANDVVSVSRNAAGSQVQILDSGQVQRLLIRLKDQPLRPYLKQRRNQLARAGKLSRTAAQQLHKSSLSHQQLLQKNQTQMVSDLRKQKLVLNVNRQFTQLTNTISITTTANALEKIRRLPQVAAIYPDSKITALLAESVPVTEAPNLWAMQDAQGRTVTGKGVSVAILDTGIDYTHPDLGGCIGAGCKVAGGYNFIEGEDSSNPIDKHGHGTHVAGIVAAKGVLTGMAPDAVLYAYKVLSDAGYGMDSGIIAALEKAVDPDGDPLTDDQIDIVNMSLGGQGAPDSPLSEAANNAMAAGVMVIVAAGNSGSTYSTIGAPGNAEQVLTVGATDNAGAIADFSSRGPVAGQAYIKPEIVAPGVNINSTKPGNGYVRLSGTSMATPHVVGGAALLKQLHPELSAAELKLLLVNNSGDLGKDVFTQGAGAMKLVASATAKVLISPSLLSAGSVDSAQANWVSDLPVNVKNISATTLALSLRAPESFPVGASAIVTTPAVALAAGQETTMVLKLMVDTQALPYAQSPTLHHEVIANLHVGDTAVRVPLVFAKAAKLNLQFVGAPWLVQVFNADASFTATHFFNSCTETPADYALDVKPGTYHVAVAFYAENCAINAMVFKENIVVDEVATSIIDRTSATNKLAVGTITDTNGVALPLDTMSVMNKEFFWNMPDVTGSLFFLSGNSPDIMWVSTVSPSIHVEVSSFFGLPPAAPATEGRYFLVDQTFTAGINTQQLLDLDMRTAGMVDFNYSDADMLANGVKLTVGASQIRSIVDFMAIGSFQTQHETYHQPVKTKAYAAIATMEKGEWYPEFGIDYLNTDPSVWNPMLMRTGPIAFPDTHSYTKLKGAFSELADITYRSENHLLAIDSSAYFIAAQFHYFPHSRELSVQNIATRNSYGFNFSFARDAAQNNFFDNIPYRQYCDSQLISDAITNGSGFNLILEDAHCAVRRIEFTQPTRFQGKPSTTLTRLIINTQKVLDSAAYQLEIPELHQVRLLNNGQESRLLNGDHVAVQISAKHGSTTQTQAPDQFSLDYRLMADGEWLPLTVTQTGVNYAATLPQLAGPHSLSLRIVLSNDQGATVQQTLNDVALIGAGAVSQLILPPHIDPLVPLVVEATGITTHYNLPLVVAKDAADGDLLAITEDLGPYALGEHAIRWQVTNSLGKTAVAIQSLSVRDTTPPEITLPPDIRITASGELTEVALGQASAFDLVDGNVIASADMTGPFAVGRHAISWTAMDAHYNYSVRLQMVIVEPMVVASSSAAAVSSSSIALSSTASSSVATSPIASSSAASIVSAASSRVSTATPSNSGGGGSSNGWMLLLGLLGASARVRFI